MKRFALVPVAAGIVIGVIASLLVMFGNPGNMGVCVACFTRDTVGALGFHRAGVVQYIRPEILGFIIGALISALLFKEFKPRAGSTPLARFFLGMFAMIGALVFLGCPWRAYLRLAGGDWNAIAGVAGLVCGILIGIFFLKRGFSLGRNRKTFTFAGYLMPILAVGLLVLLITGIQFGKAPDGTPTPPIFFSSKGPGSQHAPLIISLIAGLAIGIIAQKSRFCTIAAIRDTVLLKDNHLLQGIVAFIVAAFITNLLLGQFHPGFEGQPIAHTNTLWNFLGMVLSGLAFTLAGGCPGRQLILSGEGDSDAAIFVIGMASGAAIAHNFYLASSGAGITSFAPYAVFIGLVFCIILGFTMRERA